MLTVFKRRSRRWTQNRRQKSCRVHYSQIPSFFPNKIFPGFIKIPPLPQSSDPSSSSIFASQRLSKMASQLKVDELREELAKRGLSTTGTKPTLVRRLQSATRKEEKAQQSAADSNDSVIRKRQRDDENEDGECGNGSGKIKATEDFRKMGIKELREQAVLRGILTTGSKKELIERLYNCNDSVKESNDLEDDNSLQGEEQGKKENVVIATKKGVAVLDRWIPDDIKATYHVLQYGDDVYDATLNQTNVGDNNNKFYIIQVLESDGGGRYMFFNRWGRVGSKGQQKISGPYTSKDSATSEFESKFFDKTRNFWCSRQAFVAYPKQYTWLEMDYSKTDQESTAQEASISRMEVQPRETELEARVAKFISLICNISMMKQQMLEIGYNAEKLPLGKLSKSTILKGYDVLKRIADVIGQTDRKIIEQLSGEFYTVIPHDFGYRKMREFVIDTPQKLKCKLEMVEALGEIEVATKLLEDDIGMQDPLYSQYKRLHCELTPIDVDSQEFSMIQKYVINTHAKTHLDYTVDIVQIFRVSREGETERFQKFSKTGNRMLLWHGSRLTNWAGILSQGLRIAPPEAPVTGYMFGKGVYFADMFSKSANYCCSSRKSTAGVLLLCEVALGDMAELLTANYDADKLPQGKLSTKGVGKTAPSEARKLDDGVIVPLGRPKQQSGPKGCLLYNEYIVYDVEQIKMRYVVQVDFKYN
ncbi:hypothetical protein M9H77_01682 [Catharanthus roseus]|uniref:Uncharacterized protein n=1 Tax=Catharanthus roseus TaxID=4058 RepID=A0ACC0C6E5_CATRO|nr:hypothetical protein M9H77_01682 [Catharanthus roseus]